MNFVVGNRGSVVESDFYNKLKKLDVQEGKKDKLFACDTGMRSARSGDCVLPLAGARGYEVNCRGVEGEHWAQWEIERGTHACKASKLGPAERWWTQDGNLGITIQDPPPKVRKTDTFIVFYLFVLDSVTCLKICHFAACFTIL